MVAVLKRENCLAQSAVVATSSVDRRKSVLTSDNDRRVAVDLMLACTTQLFTWPAASDAMLRRDDVKQCGKHACDITQALDAGKGALAKGRRRARRTPKLPRARLKEDLFHEHHAP